MGEISTIAVDLAKRVFQVHGVDAEGQVVLRRQLRRSEVERFFEKLRPAVIGPEACPGAHYGGRILAAQGHEVRLVPPAYVTPFVQRQKNDAAHAAAIYEAMSRPSMRFVPVKSTEQQAAQVALRSRELLVRQRTMAINALRGHLAEFGITAGVGIHHLPALIERLNDPASQVPAYAREALQLVIDQISDCTDRRLGRRAVRASIATEVMATGRHLGSGKPRGSKRLERVPLIGIQAPRTPSRPAAAPGCTHRPDT